MKIRIITLLGAASFTLSQAAFSQGMFQNLDFELANVSGYSAGNNVPISLALPG